MRLKHILLTFFLASAAAVNASTAMPQPAADAPQADGTFRNPMQWADLPDPDVIRVGDYFYMVTTTMHLMPGAPIMRSRDLVNWETVSYVFPRLTDSPKYDMKEGTVYGRGQWATSLKYHKGRFYVLFAPNDSKGGDTYIYTTTDPTCQWELHSRLRHFHDCSLFFDDDGRVYVFYGTGEMAELTPDLKGVVPGSHNYTILRDDEENGLLEGSRMVKHGDSYYLLMISWPRNKPRRQLAYRAKSLQGPWEKRVILESQLLGFPYAGQGTIVDAADGRWYGVIFEDHGAVGRVLTLEPCTWTDGWPMLGDAQGKIPEVMELPVKGEPQRDVTTSDEFSQPTLDLRWQWNHNPDDSAWSLTARKGWLRLRTGRVVDNLFLAPNTISQRMTGPASEAVVKLDVSHMAVGDKAGMSAFNGDAGVLTVSRDRSGLTLAMEEQHVSLTDKDKEVSAVDVTTHERVALRSTTVYLKIAADFRLNQDISTYYYSTDGKQWKPIGKPFKMVYDYRRLFMGSRFAIFNYATRKAGGYVDVDFFRYKRDDQL